MLRLEAANKNNAKDLLEIYDSGNTLFDANKRASGTLDIFDKIIKEDKVIIAYIDNDAAGFISYNDTDEPIIINSLYIKRDFQRRGIGKTLLYTFENGNLNSRYIVAKVLKNAPWAISFYSANGYRILHENDSHEILNSMLKNIQFEKWSYIMFKSLQ